MKSWLTSSVEDWESFSSRDDMGCTEHSSSLPLRHTGSSTLQKDLPGLLLHATSVTYRAVLKSAEECALGLSGCSPAMNTDASLIRWYHTKSDSLDTAGLGEGMV